jgi:hypothetical protein
MVGLEVEQDGDTGAERLDVLELKGRELAHDPRSRIDRTDEGGQRAADVPGDLDRHPGGSEHGAEQLARGGLSVGSGDAENRVRQEPCAELDLAPDRDRVRARAGDESRLPRDARALDDEIGPLQQRLLLCSEMDFDAELVEPSRVELFVAVESHDLGARVDERLGGGRSRACEPDDEDAPATELRSGGHFSTKWRKSR